MGVLTLLREEVRLNCPDCGHTLRFIRDKVSERLEYVQARFIVRRHVRPRCAASGPVALSCLAGG